MSFSITHRYGAMSKNPSLSALSRLLAELDNRPEDLERCSVAVTHETEWSLGISRSGNVVYENLEENSPRQMKKVSRVRILELCEALARGELKRLEQEDWQAGYS